MYLLFFMIIYCNIFTNSMLFKYNKLIRLNSNNILKCNYGSKNNKHNIISDSNMPILYSKINIDSDNLKNVVYSLEHIYPISFMTNEAKTDMHNLFKTTKYLNNARSNYKFVDHNEYILYPNNTWFTFTNDVNSKNWIKLENDNYVNHKKKLFIPTNESKGIISRSILYITFKYKYKLERIINIDTLISWYLNYPPSNAEKYHNNYVKKIQYTDNKFISSYKSNIKLLIKLKKHGLR
jgi:hypothetical protein